MHVKRYLYGYIIRYTEKNAEYVKKYVLSDFVTRSRQHSEKLRKVKYDSEMCRDYIICEVMHALVSVKA